MNSSAGISIERYPSDRYWHSLAPSFDLWIESTDELQQAPCFNWLFWLRGKAHDKVMMGSPQSIFWAFPCPPSQPMTYGWIKADLSPTVVQENLKKILHLYRHVGIIQHGAGQKISAFAKTLSETSCVVPVHLPFLLKRDQSPRPTC